MEMNVQLYVPTALSAENNGWEVMGSSVCISTGYELGGREIGVRFPAGARNLSLLHSLDTRSGAHTVSYSMGTRVSFFGGNAVRMRICPPTSI
jgi:hypothetical protein